MSVGIEKELITWAKNAPKTIVFPEAGFSPRILKAAVKINKLGIAKVVLIGKKSSMLSVLTEKQLACFEIVDPESSNLNKELIEFVFNARKAKGLTMAEAENLCLDPIYFANAYVACGYADGIVCGAEVATAKTLRPALQLIKSKNGLVSSYFLFVGKNNVTNDAFLMGDCGVVENPNAEQECQIAELMIEQSKMLKLGKPKVAFLSYSTLGSAKSDSIQKVRSAYEMFAKQNPKVDAIGEVQFDASILKNVAKTKMPNVKFTKPSNIFVMPNIDAGNIGYKLVQYFGGLKAIGPITMGFNKPVNDLSRGCTIDDIVLLTAITCLQANVCRS